MSARRGGKPHTWRDRHTHTLQVKRTGHLYDSGRKYGSWVTWVTTSCGKHLTDRADPNFGYKYIDGEATNKFNHGRKGYTLKYLPRDVWLISGWDKLDIKAVTHNPTCASCRKTTKPIRKTATSKNSDVAVRTRARIAGR